MESIRSRWKDLLAEHPRLEDGAREARRWFPINFITIHYTYFTLTCVVSSLVFWGSSQPFRSVSYTDSLFLVTSAMTSTGLNTRNLSEMTTWQQIILWFLMILGSPIWVSFWTVIVRKHAFEQRFDDIVEAEREMRKRQAAKNSGAMTLRRALPFRKNVTEPPADNVLPGLGSKQKERDGSLMAEPTDLGMLGPPARRIISAPTGTPRAPFKEYDSSTSATTTQEAPAVADIGRGHIVFSDTAKPPNGASPSAYTHENSLFPRRYRPSSSSSDTDSDASEDFMYHWRKILHKEKVGRNGQFYDLTSDERERLGGCEYRALKLLAFTVPMYAFLWQLIPCIALGAWMVVHRPNRESTDGVNAWWVGIFYGVSAFNNVGMSLIDDNMIPFQSSYFVLIVIGTLVVAGNTAYPILLRLTFWTALQFLKLTTPTNAYAPTKETLEFILKYPRRVYTTLFPSRATWWLLTTLVFINMVDWLAFEIMNIGNEAIEALPVGDRIMGGLFQAVSVRAAGFTVVAMPLLYVGVQLLYTIMMYISIYPVVITMRSSNVYEERSLGIYEDDPAALAEVQNDVSLVPSGPSDGQTLRRRRTGAVIGNNLKRVMTFQGVGVRAPPKNSDESPVSFIGQQIRGQLAHDLWWLVLAVLIIVTIETDHFLGDPTTFSVFNILFESISAYACVGLSMGLPNASYSFSGGWHTASKIILIFVMLRGRHRGLPVAVDRAVRLPGEKLHKEEEEDFRIRRSKTLGRITSRGM
ncbi:cation transport protein-domain-containing protein [Stachybotrys elegans]|uniref:Potassium transport protein n=1 Tax=Stachybotrys elegans TaxID=80388 RepID=A0A8K0WTQ5_9HYPO|nr:cation transport protein-domain-containing protein [Stachybotrys elegans]